MSFWDWALAVSLVLVALLTTVLAVVVALQGGAY